MNTSTIHALEVLTNIDHHERRMLEVYGRLPEHIQDAYNDHFDQKPLLVDEGTHCSFCWVDLEDNKTYIQRPCGHFFCLPCLGESVTVQAGRAPYYRCCGIGCNHEFMNEEGDKVRVRVVVKIE